VAERIIVVGGGPAGYEAALSLSRAGMEVTLIEKNRPGGVCVNSGCVPTRIYLQAVKSAGFLDTEKMRQLAEERIQQLSYGIAYLLQKQGVCLVQDEAVSVEEGSVTLASGKSLAYDYLIAATGSKRVQPESISFERRYTPDELLKLTDLPGKLSIVGGGVLGIELAVIMNAAGVKVSLFEKENQLLPGWDEDVADAICVDLKRRGIEINTGSKEERFAEAVFCCGRVPVLPRFAAGALEDGRIFVIGDAAGGSMTADAAAEAGRRIGEKIAAGSLKNIAAEIAAGSPGSGGNLPGQEEKLLTSVMSRCLFTPLEAAMTGALAADSDHYKESYYGADSSASGMIFGTKGAFAKAVMEKDSHILKGFHLVSALATETIQLGQLAVSQEMTAEDFVRQILPHPTEGELLKEAVRRLL